MTAARCHSHASSRQACIRYAVPNRQMLRIRRLSRCRAISLHSNVSAREQAPGNCAVPFACLFEALLMSRCRAMHPVRNVSACEQAPSGQFRPVCAPLVETRTSNPRGRSSLNRLAFFHAKRASCWMPFLHEKSARRESNPRPPPWQGGAPPLSHSRMS